MQPLASLFAQYPAIVLFDTETTGLNFARDQIIELAAMRVAQAPDGTLSVTDSFDTFLSLPDGQTLPPKIVELTGITDAMLADQGISHAAAAAQFVDLLGDTPTLLVAHNAHFDACFLRPLLRGQKLPPIGWLDTVTVFKDRRAYPHRLQNAIEAYDLSERVQNSHRAIDDLHALFAVLEAMDSERADLHTYINLFGYNPKYGVEGTQVRGVHYAPQPFQNAMTTPAQTLPATTGIGTR